MVAMMKRFFCQQAAFKAVDQRKNPGVNHLCSKKKRPPAIGTGGRDFSSFRSLAGIQAKVKVEPLDTIRPFLGVSQSRRVVRIGRLDFEKRMSYVHRKILVKRDTVEFNCKPSLRRITDGQICCLLYDCQS